MIDWLVFNANFSNNSAIPWRELDKYMIIIYVVVIDMKKI